MEKGKRNKKVYLCLIFLLILYFPSCQSAGSGADDFYELANKRRVLSGKENIRILVYDDGLGTTSQTA